MKPEKLFLLLTLAALLMVLPLASGVNAHSVNIHKVWADGNATPPPIPNFIDGAGDPPPPFPPPHFADGAGDPPPPFPPPAISWMGPEIHRHRFHLRISRMAQVIHRHPSRLRHTSSKARP